MKKVGIVVFVLIIIGSGIYLIRSMRYYGRSGLEKQVAEMRKQKQEGKQKPIEKQKKEKDIEAELKKFYGTIELTAEQKTYAEETMRVMEPELAKYHKELAQLTRTTRQTMIKTLALPASEYNRATPEKIYQALQKEEGLNDNLRQQLAVIYQDYLTKRKELNHALNSAKQSYTQTLLNLLAEDQKKIYQQEHLPKNKKS